MMPSSTPVFINTLPRPPSPEEDAPSQQIDDDNNYDAQQSEVKHDELPACLAIVSKGGELGKGSAPLEGVSNAQKGEEAEIGESFTALFAGEVDGLPGGSALLDGDALPGGSGRLVGDELGPLTTPTEKEETSIPTEHVRNGPNLRSKTAKRTLPCDPTEDEIQLALPRPQDEDIQETKRPRLESPLPTATYEATIENNVHDTKAALPPNAAVADHFDSDHVMDMHMHSMRGLPGPTRQFQRESAYP